jgi:hypothetical protein
MRKTRRGCGGTTTFTTDGATSLCVKLLGGHRPFVAVSPIDPQAAQSALSRCSPCRSPLSRPHPLTALRRTPPSWRVIVPHAAAFPPRCRSADGITLGWGPSPSSRTAMPQWLRSAMSWGGASALRHSLSRHLATSPTRLPQLVLQPRTMRSLRGRGSPRNPPHPRLRTPSRLRDVQHESVPWPRSRRSPPFHGFSALQRRDAGWKRLGETIAPGPVPKGCAELTAITHRMNRVLRDDGDNAIPCLRFLEPDLGMGAKIGGGSLAVGSLANAHR